MIRTYEEARAAVGYLHRHDGDADAIAPNLYAGKSRRRPDGQHDRRPDATSSGAGRDRACTCVRADRRDHDDDDCDLIPGLLARGRRKLHHRCAEGRGREQGPVSILRHRVREGRSPESS